MKTSSAREKPLLRGHFHQAAFFYALGAGTILVTMAQGSRALVASLVYSFCLAALFGISSLYHRVQWSQQSRVWLRRLDHAAIFIFIAGTATPICLLGLSPEVGRELLSLFWACATLGVLKELLWVQAPKWVSAVFYVLMGWLAGPYMSAFFSDLGLANTWFLVAGGVVYTLGALIYAMKWPDPFPRFFGYHEVFHLLVMIASAFHFVVIYRLIA